MFRLLNSTELTSWARKILITLNRLERTMAGNVPVLKLNDSKSIPILGLGTWKSKQGEVVQAVKDAIDIGYRHIDGALVYRNEKEVGQAIQSKISEGVVKREDLFLTGKLWCTFHRPDLVVSALKQSLTDLGVDYIDLYLIHWPMAFLEGDDLFPKDPEGNPKFSDVDYVDTWKAMEECVSSGLAKSIGLSNFNSKQIERILSGCKITPAINQIECHPYLNQSKLVEFCKNHKIQITAYSPFGSPDRPWATSSDPRVLDDPVLIDIGKRYGKTPAQVILRWLIQREISVIPKSVTKHRIKENFEVFDFSLTEEELVKINSLNRDLRSLRCEWYSGSSMYPFTIEF